MIEKGSPQQVICQQPCSGLNRFDRLAGMSLAVFGDIPEGADWAKKKGVFKMWIEHGPQSLLGLWLAPRGRLCSEFLFAPELEPSNLRGPCLILCGVDPTFHHKIFTADHPLHQMAYFCVVWCCCNKQIWLQKKSSEKMKCVVMWLNMCCLS